MGGRKRKERVIAVVDDDASLRRSVANLLSSVGFQVEAFASAEAFLASIQRAQTGCLVLDLRLTGMSGIDLLEQLAAAGAKIPVVMLTAYSDDLVRERAVRGGALALLAKPFQPDDLLEAVRRAMQAPAKP